MRVKVFVIHYKEDDPSKCTALKMVRSGKAKLVYKPPLNTLLLDPYVPTPVSRRDREIVSRFGITVVDASWKKPLSRKFSILRRRAAPRRLPLLFAANPAHYGLAYKLSSLEAVAATLIITGFWEDATELLSLYKWGETFLKLNEELLKEYSNAPTPEEIMDIEAELLSKILGLNVKREDVEKLISKLAS